MNLTYNAVAPYTLRRVGRLIISCSLATTLIRLISEKKIYNSSLKNSESQITVPKMLLNVLNFIKIN